MWMETGPAGVFLAGATASVMVAVWDTEAPREASKAVTVMLFVPATRGIALASHTPFEIAAEPLEEWSVCHCTVTGATPPETRPEIEIVFV